MRIAAFAVVAVLAAMPGLGLAMENVSFAYADVLRSEPFYETVRVSRPVEECYEDTVVHREGSSGAGGAVVGAIIGGVIGNQVGKGSGRKAATVAGAVAGSAIGSETARRNHPERYHETSETRCRIVDGWAEERRIAGFDVEYRYRGQVYMSRLPYDPGERLRIRVSVTPAE
ncbi:MAG TPA: glycine zipper 2TM domain-containing protein [Xanthomonadaceae bacterium]|nr:glycine zipper 2TM domain-containing protein [Xanthomonadaceae bacterium]